MIPFPSALKAHLALPSQTTCSLLILKRSDDTVLGFTDHDTDIVFVGLTYASTRGYQRTDIASNSDMAVDNLEINGMLNSPFITEDDLRAGLWDYAQVKISIVNYMDLTMGEGILRVGRLGEVTVSRNMFNAELRGLMQAYSRVIGELAQPSCRALLGDSRCKIDLSAFTVTGTITAVGSDNRTLSDTARTEAGPSGGIAITGVTKANPGVVTLASALGLPSGSPVVISGVAGMDDINGTTVANNVSGDHFDLGIDTTSYPTYTGGGMVTPLGGDSGYFDNGVFTATSGLNMGLSMEVQSYVPGLWILALPMPYPMAIGDTYSMHAGCDYSMATCRDRFDNIVNFRGEPYLPGTDKLMQIGKQ